jgi:hypothetical protein
LPWSAVDIETLKAAILDRKGARQITFADQSVTFDSIDDMRKLLADMQADVNTASNRSSTRYAATRKGV